MINSPRRLSAAILGVAAVFTCGPSVTQAHPPEVPPAAEAGALPDDLGKLIAWLETRLEKAPGDPVALSSLAGARLRLARATTRHTDFEAAARAFIQYRDHGGDPLGAAVGIAQARMGQHRFGEALSAAQAAVAARRDDLSLLLLLGDVHMSLGNLVEAGLIFEKAEQQELTLETLSRVALVREAEGQPEEAHTAMTEAIEAGRLLSAPDPAIAWCESMLGEFALDAGNLEEAQARFKAARALDANLHHAAFRLADIARRQGDLHAAEDALIALVAAFPLPRYLILLGDIQVAHGREHQDDATVAAGRQALARAERLMTAEVEQGDLGHARELVEFWLAHDGPLDRAVELARRDLETIRHDAGAFETAAWALLKAGREAEAVPLMKQALDRGPGSARAIWRAALLADKAGNAEEASRLRARALELNPRIESDWMH